MERINFLQFKGVSILIEDFTNLRPGQEFLDTIQTAQTLIAKQPPKSVLAVLDATNASYNSEILAKMKDFVQANTPYIKCATVVGITGLLSVALITMSKASGRDFNNFATRQEAIDFLVAQK
jgi:hypothetical protein